MPLAKANLILHPTRLRILMALAGKQLTPQQLAEHLPDVPQATLYRHIKTLAKGDILTIVAERPVRGTVEKVYALPDHAAILSTDDLASLEPEDLMRIFVMYLASLIGDFARYIQRPDAHPVADRLSFGKFPMYLSDQELADLNAKIGALFLPLLENGPGDGRRRRIVASIFIPDAGERAE